MSQSHQTTPPKDNLRPASILRSAWVVAIVASLLFANDVHRTAIKTTRFQSDNGWLSYATAGLQWLSDTLGIAPAGDALQALPNPLDASQQSLKPVFRRLPPRRPPPRRRTIKRPPPRKRQNDAPQGQLTMAPQVKRLLLVGASSMFAHPGTRIERRLKRDYLQLTVHRLGKISSSISRPDYFDWPKTLKLLMKSFQPDTVLANFGFNDIQSLPYKEKGRTKYVDFINDFWRSLYFQKLRPFLDIMQTGNARIAWLGYARMPKEEHTKTLSLIHELYRDELAKRNGLYLSWWRLSEDPTGQKPILEEITYEGETGPARLPDGIHFTVLGAKFMARAFCQQLERHYYFIHKDKRLASIRQLRWSKATPKQTKKNATKTSPKRKVPKRPTSLKRRTPPRKPPTPKAQLHALLFMPRSPKKAQRPDVLLLHFVGKQARFAPIEAHRLLQRQAQKHQKAIIVAIDPTLDSNGKAQPIPTTSLTKRYLAKLSKHRKLVLGRTIANTAYPMDLDKHQHNKEKRPDWGQWRRQLRSWLTKQLAR